MFIKSYENEWKLHALWHNQSVTDNTMWAACSMCFWCYVRASSVHPDITRQCMKTPCELQAVITWSHVSGSSTHPGRVNELMRTTMRAIASSFGMPCDGTLNASWHNWSSYLRKQNVSCILHVSSMSCERWVNVMRADVNNYFMVAQTGCKHPLPTMPCEGVLNAIWLINLLKFHACCLLHG